MRVCLNMIVRNEAAVIGRCLASVRPFIDGYCIVDTGSTDGTQALIERSLAGLPGRLLERVWVDQAHNRNEALDLARGSGAAYLLLIDADEVLEAESGFALPDLTADAYEFTVRYGGLEFARTQIVRAELPWRWIGRRHPALRALGATGPVPLPGLYTVPRTDGASWSDPDKYRRHAAELEADVAADPTNPRLRYYLAQSYRDAGTLGQALACYRARAEMVAGWQEETWSALYEAAKICERLHRPYAEVVTAYIAACRFRPTRAEPFFRLGCYLRWRGDFALALLFAREAARLPRPADRLFVEAGVYRTAALVELERIALAAGDVGEAQRARSVLTARTRPITQGEMTC